MVALSEPPVLVAVMVYSMGVLDSSLGVPLITPVERSRVKPLGKVGSMAYDTTSPPEEVGSLSVMRVPMVYSTVASL